MVFRIPSALQRHGSGFYSREVGELLGGLSNLMGRKDSSWKLGKIGVQTESGGFSVFLEP